MANRRSALEIMPGLFASPITPARALPRDPRYPRFAFFFLFYFTLSVAADERATSSFVESHALACD